MTSNMSIIIKYLYRALINLTVSVLVDAKEADLVEGGQLGNEDKCQAHAVDDEMQVVVFRVGGSKDEEQDGNDGEELPRRGVLHPVV